MIWCNFTYDVFTLFRILDLFQLPLISIFHFIIPLLFYISLLLSSLPSPLSHSPLSLLFSSPLTHILLLPNLLLLSSLLFPLYLILSSLPFCSLIIYSPLLYLPFSKHLLLSHLLSSISHSPLSLLLSSISPSLNISFYCPPFHPAINSALGTTHETYRDDSCD